MAVFAFIGFGELGTSLAEGLGRSDALQLRAYAPERSLPAARAALESRLRRTGVRRSATLEEALTDATVVLSVVPAGASRAVAARCAPLLEPGAYYVDFAPAPVADKEQGAALIAQAGALYVDAAVLGTVATSGFEVPIIASGPGARGWRALVDAHGLVVETIEAPAGHATLVKLLRSVYMKGRDALIVEMMLAARRYGLEARVAESIQVEVSRCRSSSSRSACCARWLSMRSVAPMSCAPRARWSVRAGSIRSSPARARRCWDISRSWIYARRSITSVRRVGRRCSR